MTHPSSLRLAVVLGAVLLVKLAATSGADAATVGVTLSGTEFHTGQTLTMGVSAVNPAGSPPADLYAGVLLPDGRTMVFLSPAGALAGTGVLTSPAGFIRTQAAPAGFALNSEAFARIAVPPNVPPGTYLAFAALIRQGALADNRLDAGDLLAVELKPFIVAGIIQDGTSDPGEDEAGAVTTDAAGNIYIVGTCAGTVADADRSDGGYYCAARYGPDRRLHWVTQFGGTGGNFARAVAVDTAGNVYAAGDGRLPGETGAGGLNDLWLVKFDARGIKQWQRQLGSAGTDNLFGIALDREANVFVVGATNGTLPDQTRIGFNNDAFVIKFDTSGTRLWIRQFGSGSGAEDYARGVVADSTGNVYVVGHQPSVEGNRPESGYVAKFDGSGNRLFLSEFRIDRDNGLQPYAVALDEPRGRLYVTGQVRPTSASLIGMFVAGLDTAGSLDWVQRIGAAPLPQASSTVVIGQSIAVNADGSGVFAAGYTNSVVTGLTGSGGEDVVVARYAPDGEREWVKQFGAVGRATRPDGLNDRGNGLALDPGGDVVVAGLTQGLLGSPGSNPGNRTIRDWFIAFLRAADGVFK